MRIAALTPIKLLLPALPLVAIAIVGITASDPAPAPQIAETVRGLQPETFMPLPQPQPQQQPRPQPQPRPVPVKTSCPNCVLAL